MTWKLLYSVLTVALLLDVGVCSGGEAWEIEMRAGIRNATNRLVIGQAADATEGIDGRHDIPALLGGDIRAYLALEGEAYWKDIRGSCESPCEKIWSVTVDSGLAGENVTIAWDASGMPEGASLELTDESTGRRTDMRQVSSYLYENAGTRAFTVRAFW
jgi:hypothetical protein